MLYAAAAALERCSFVNGGSQNTICPALSALAAENGCYILGTDFKAGQTKVSICLSSKQNVEGK
jgi:myo-inositol-1-phosphate synthase